MRILLYIAAASVLVACVSQIVQVKSEGSERKKEKRAKISRASAKNVKVEGPTLSETETCRQFVAEIVPALQKLSKQLRLKNNADTLTARVAQLSPNQCQGRLQAHANALVSTFLNRKPTTIGVILPLSGVYAHLGLAVRQGIESFCQKQGTACLSKFIIRDNHSSPPGTLAALADLLIEREVGIIIGGIHATEAETLANFSQNLQLPVLIANKTTNPGRDNLFALQVYPQDVILARALADATLKRQIRAVSVLQPHGGKSDSVTVSFVRELQKRGIQTNTISYISGDFESMNSAVQTIAGTGVADRRAEYMQLYREAAEKARSEKTPFLPQSVVLKPKMNSDAVFIPDNFRIVRHFVNLFKYHGIHGLTLIGSNEWRSSGLLNPWDNFLRGAFFADFIGSYKDLPGGIQRTLDRSEFFVSPTEIISVDFQLLGYHAASMGWEALTAEDAVRRNLAQLLAERKEAHAWPVYVLAVANQNLEISE